MSLIGLSMIEFGGGSSLNIAFDSLKPFTFFELNVALLHLTFAYLFEELFVVLFVFVSNFYGFIVVR